MSTGPKIRNAASRASSIAAPPARVTRGTTNLDETAVAAALAETPEAARGRLAKTAYGIQNAEYTLQSLATILVYLSQEKSVKVYSTCTRDVAILLNHLEQSTITNAITKDIRDAIQPEVDTLREATRKCEEATARALEAATTTPTPTPTPAHPPANAWAAGPPHAKHREDMARFRIERRRFYIDSENRALTAASLDVTDEALLERGRLALENMHVTDNRPTTLRIVAARRLANKGVVYELESEQAAKWLGRPATRAAFLHAYGEGVVLRMKAYQLIGFFVPVAFQPHEPTALDRVTVDNRIPAGALTHARWIKRPDRRHSGQRVAHVIFTFESPEAANAIIDEGLLVENTRISCEKAAREPRSCLKCQVLDQHFIANCPAEHYTCGTCGQDHPTSECTVKSPGDRCCANCVRHPEARIRARARGHATWARTDCPSFASALAKYRTIYPECRYRHFPTEDPTTWSLNNAGSSPTPAEATSEPLIDRISDPKPRAPTSERIKTTTQHAAKATRKQAKEKTANSESANWRERRAGGANEGPTPTQIIDDAIRSRPASAMARPRTPNAMITDFYPSQTSTAGLSQRPRASTLASIATPIRPARPSSSHTTSPDTEPTTPFAGNATPPLNWDSDVRDTYDMGRRDLTLDTEVDYSSASIQP
jgi:hypothetical protein